MKQTKIQRANRTKSVLRNRINRLHTIIRKQNQQIITLTNEVQFYKQKANEFYNNLKVSD